MADSATEFFEEIHARGHEPLLAKARGTLQFELTDVDTVETWVLQIDRGDVVVSRDAVESACRIQSSRKLFDGVITGRQNAMAAMLRGEIVYDGDTELLMLFQRVFPGPPGSVGPARIGDARSAQ
jgi:putative sterol carrier protein